MFQIVLETKASGHGARGLAKKNAADNSKQLIKDFTLEYNKLRQTIIAKAFLEITSAARGV